MGTDLPGVHDVERVDGALHGAHELDGALAELLSEIFLLANANSVLARACDTRQYLFSPQILQAA